MKVKKIVTVTILGFVALLLGLGVGYLLSRTRLASEPGIVTPPSLSPPRELTAEEKSKAIQGLSDPNDKDRYTPEQKRVLLQALGEPERDLSRDEQIKVLELLNQK